jgi:hypothetical protein
MAQFRLKQLDSILTGSLQVSGSSGITGSLNVSLTGSFGYLNIAGNAGFDEYIHHRGDTDTFIQFDSANDRINIAAGGENMIYIVEGSGGDQADKVTINNDLADVDFQVKGDNETNLIRTDAANDRVGIGTSVPSQTLTVAGNISSSGYIYGDGSNLSGITSGIFQTTGSTQNTTGTLQVTGSLNVSSSFSISDKEVDPHGVSRDQVLKFNGTKFVPADYDATFTFSISDFDMNHTSTPVLIGSGSWKAIGGITFTATYDNGPPDGYNGSAEGAPRIIAYEDGSQSGSYFYPLSSSFSTGTNTERISFPPNSSDDIRFRLYASAGSDTDTDYTDQRIYFYNQFVYGELSNNNGFDQADIRTLAAANTVTSNDTTRTLSVSIGGSNYLCFAHRTGDTNVAQVQCGSGTNILTVAMDRSDATALTPLKETVSYLNTAGHTENFYVYASKLANIDSHSSTFVTLTSTQKKNYFYWGYDAQASSYDESFLETSGDWDSHNANSSYDDGTVTGQTLSVGSFTSKYVIIAIPNRYGDNDTEYQFKDNSTNLPFDVTQQADVTVTNVVGFQEDYSVYRSTNLLTMTNLTVLIDTV